MDQFISVSLWTRKNMEKECTCLIQMISTMGIGRKILWMDTAPMSLSLARSTKGKLARDANKDTAGASIKMEGSTRVCGYLTTKLDLEKLNSPMVSPSSAYSNPSINKQKDSSWDHSTNTTNLSGRTKASSSNTTGKKTK